MTGKISNGSPKSVNDGFHTSENFNTVDGNKKELNTYDMQSSNQDDGLTMIGFGGINSTDSQKDDQGEK